MRPLLGFAVLWLDIVSASLCGHDEQLYYLVSGPHGVTDDQITHSSSRIRPTHNPSYARLYLTEQRNWCPLQEDIFSSYIQVEFNWLSNVTAVVTQGQITGVHRWAKEYGIQYSVDGITWFFVEQINGSVKVFIGNTDPNTPVIGNIGDVIEIRFLRLHPYSWHTSVVCLRFDVLGCQRIDSCASYLVSGPNGVQNHNLLATSARDINSCPEYARLDSNRSWCPSPSDNSPFIQDLMSTLWGLLSSRDLSTRVTSKIEVNGRRISTGCSFLDDFKVTVLDIYKRVKFNCPCNVTGLLIQGNPEAQEWITHFSVGYSYDGQDWQVEKGFIGSIDRNTQLFNALDNATRVRFLRIYPERFFVYPCLRFDVLGCEAETSKCCLSCHHNYTSDELSGMVRKLKEDTKKEKKNTGNFIRSKTSAPDERLSSKAIGWVSVTVISVVIAAVVIGDIFSFIKQIT